MLASISGQVHVAGASSKVPYSDAPMIGISARDGFGANAAQSLQLANGETVTVASGQDTQFVAGGQMRMHSGQAIGALGGAVAAGEGGLGLQIIAAKDAVDIQAQADALKVQARDAVNVVSANAHVDWAAAKRISLSTAGGASITIEGGNILVECPGKIMVNAGKKSFAGPSRLTYNLSHCPQLSGIDLREYDEQFHLVSHINQPIENARYRITSSSGEIFEGTTDHQGYTQRVRTRDAVDLTIEILSLEEHELVVGDSLDGF
jgi:uncharacterized protein (DUF2345 family)